jgi:hypothetical protein
MENNTYSVEYLSLHTIFSIKWYKIESGIKHHNPNPRLWQERDDNYNRKVKKFCIAG